MIDYGHSKKKNMAYRLFFIIGFIFFIVGQVLLAQGNDFVYSLKPIDFAHWFLLIGAVFLIPQVVSFPIKRWNYVGIPLSLAGIVCIIGMCVLDFIWWSYPTEEARIAFTNHVSQIPSIWKPFITIGSSSKVFNIGLFLLSLNYFKQEKIGVILIFIATLILLHIIPLPFRLIFGYSFTLIGFSIILFRKDIKSWYEKRSI
jgi:hypothetical protein